MTEKENSQNDGKVLIGNRMREPIVTRVKSRYEHRYIIKDTRRRSTK